MTRLWNGWSLNDAASTTYVRASHDIEMFMHGNWLRMKIEVAVADFLCFGPDFILDNPRNVSDAKMVGNSFQVPDTKPSRIHYRPKPRSLVQGDQKLSAHLTITIQKVTIRSDCLAADRQG
jgi:hypothetical protein